MTKCISNRSTSPVEGVFHRRDISSLVLAAGFSLTGAGTVMLGVLLPALSQKWGLRDDAAGFLFFLQFSGSALGAVLTGTNRVRSLMIGYGLLVVSSCALAFAGPRVSFGVFFFYGLGLGVAMTATSLLISDRYGNDRAAKLEGLNFAWSAGAMAAPVLFLPFLHAASLRPIFFTFQGLFLLILVWVIVREYQGTPHSRVDEASFQGSAPTGSLLPLLVLAMCAVGVESALSGWLTTYFHRADPQNAGGASFVTSFFWFGIMLSRLVLSTPLLAKVGRHAALRAILWGLAAFIALLIVSHTPAVIQAASGLSGLCIGPLYPLLLSFLLERSARGWIFAVAGMGSALFPWLTGLLSAHLGSLRYGLAAPCGAVLVMIVLQSISLRGGDSPDAGVSAGC